MSFPGELAPISALETHEGRPVKFAELQGKVVGLYFSASWCPPCVAFSPELNAFAKAHSNDFVVILVSHDHNEADFVEYSSHKDGFLRIPWSDRTVREQLSAQFGIYALPTLQIVSPEGKSITSWGKMAVSSNPEGCLEGWKNGSMGVVNKCVVM